jgi:thiamine kinase-like enzyme
LSSDKIHAINTSHQTLTMGDFWTGNIIVCLGDTNNDSQLSLERVYVLDWELAKPGLAGLDVGQFCAEMHLLRRFSPLCDESVTTTLNAFFEAYRNEFEVGVEIVKDAAVHVGAHLVAWTPRVPWGGKERTRDVVNEGVEYLVEGYTGTREWLGGSIVGPLL